MVPSRQRWCCDFALIAGTLTWSAGTVGAGDATVVKSAAIANTSASAADSNSDDWLPLGLQSYEPSAFGYTKNNDDVGFYNIKLSVKFPLMPRLTTRWLGHDDRLFFAFTGVFDFYIGTRDSGPVVGKEYNPQLFLQHKLNCNADRYQSPRTYCASLFNSGRADFSCYVQLGYDHDSNGQIIDTPGQYLQAQRSQGTEAANDAISRGWDYLGVTAKFNPQFTHDYRTI